MVPAQALAVFSLYGLVPAELTAALEGRYDQLPHEAVTIVTSMFIHGGFFHIIGNMLYMWIFANNIEDAMGHFKFSLFYVLGGVFAAMFQYYCDTSSKIPMVGASGAISAVLGAYLVRFPRAKIISLFILWIVRIPAIIFLTFWFFVQLLSSSREGVAWYAHIGGFIFGLAYVLLFARKTGRPQKKNTRKRTTEPVR